MDRDVIRLVVGILGGISVVSVIGMVALCFVGKEPPSALVAIAATSVGSLSGILVTQKEPRL